MDTTPPSQAVTFQSPPGIGVGQTHATGRPDATRPFVPLGSCLAPVTNSAFHSQTSPHPTFAASDGQQGASLFPRPPAGDQAAAVPGPSSGAPAAVIPRSPPGDQAAAVFGHSSGAPAAVIPGPPPGDHPTSSFPGFSEPP